MRKLTEIYESIVTEYKNKKTFKTTVDQFFSKIEGPKWKKESLEKHGYLPIEKVNGRFFRTSDKEMVQELIDRAREKINVEVTYIDGSDSQIPAYSWRFDLRNYEFSGTTTKFNMYDMS
jgi:hypothetical protein